MKKIVCLSFYDFLIIFGGSGGYGANVGRNKVGEEGKKM
jgi:hypothetical protein